MALGLYLLLRFLPRIDPGRANYRTFAGAYAWLRVSLISFMAILYAIMLASAFGATIAVPSVMPAALGVLFIVLGALMGKLRPNWFVGIRTPWTLSSKNAWIRTHRLGGWLFMLVGVGMLLTGLFDARAVFIVMAVGLIGSVIFLMYYSWRVWREDPEKVQPADTAPANDDQP